MPGRHKPRDDPLVSPLKGEVGEAGEKHETARANPSALTHAAEVRTNLFVAGRAYGWAGLRKQPDHQGNREQDLTPSASTMEPEPHCPDPGLASGRLPSSG